jgi:hypothetical protein
LFPYLGCFCGLSEKDMPRGGDATTMWPEVVSDGELAR